MENKRPIEKLLRRYANKRRDDAGQPLAPHPATRRLLQGEVARQYRKGRGVGAGTGLGAQLRSRWIFATGVGVLLAIIAVIFLPPVEKAKPTLGNLAALDQSASVPIEGLRVARDETQKTPEMPAFLPPATEPAAPPPATVDQGEPVVEVGTSDNSIRESAINNVTETNGEVAELGPAPEPAYAMPAAETSPVLTRGIALTAASQAVTAEAKKDASALAGFTFTNNLASASAGAVWAYGGREINQKFINNAGQTTDNNVGALKQSPAAAVLNNFSCEQTGNRLRIVDGDGSTYSGWIELLAEKNKESIGKPARPAGAVGGEATQNYIFRVTGTNITLHQQVTFGGNLISRAQAGPMRTSTPAVAGQMQNVEPAQLLLNSTIVGKARVGGTEVDVNAVPVTQ